jgi:hypothetical protein
MAPPWSLWCFLKDEPFLCPHRFYRVLGTMKNLYRAPGALYSFASTSATLPEPLKSPTCLGKQEMYDFGSV